MAPHNIEFEDKRIYAWLDTIGSDDCRKRTLSYQRSLLEKRKKYIPKVVKLARKQDIRYTYFSPEQAFEFAVLEFPFSLWQWGHGCENIPSPDASKKQQLKFLDDVSSFSFWGDGAMENYGSHYYQAATQMGYYGYETEDFEGLLKALPMNPHPHAAFVPNKMNFTYDGTLSKKGFEWLKTEGNNFIYIYGANDTWTATGVPRSDQVNSHWFILKGKHHGNARIRNMNREEQIELVGALEEWLEMEIE